MARAVVALCMCLLAVAAQAQTTTAPDGRKVVDGVYETPGIPPSASTNLTASGIANASEPKPLLSGNIISTNITGGAGYGQGAQQPSAAIAAAAAPYVARVFNLAVTADSVAQAAAANPAPPVRATPAPTAAATPRPTSPEVYGPNTTGITSFIQGGAGYGKGADNPSAAIANAAAPKVARVFYSPVVSAPQGGNGTSTSASNVSGRRLLHDTA